MKRRAFIAGLLALVGRGAWAQGAAAGPRRIGLLVQGSYASRGHLDRALVEALREQGYEEGRNLVIERRYGDGGGRARLRTLARELEGLGLDAVVTTCTPSTQSMKEVTTTTPIVMAVVADPVGQDLIESLARPGRNITGTSSQAEEVLPKLAEFAAALLPRGARVAVLADSRNRVHHRLWERFMAAAAAAGVEPVRHEIALTAEIEPAIDAASRAGASGLLLLPDHPIYLDERARIVAALARNRIPGFFWAREFVEAGGLLSYGENIAGGWVRSSTYVSRVMRGARPADLPVSLPTRFELVVNLKTARDLGLTVPQAILLRADRVID